MVARVIMQLFDRKLVMRQQEMGVTVYDVVSYMDDIRAVLPPFKSGWRWLEGGIFYCKRWEIEDCSLTPIERTRRILAGVMGGMEPFLTFTMVNVLGTVVTILGTVVTILGTVVTIQGMVGDQPTVSGRPSWGRCATIIWILVDHRGDTR